MSFYCVLCSDFFFLIVLSDLKHKQNYLRERFHQKKRLNYILNFSPGLFVAAAPGKFVTGDPDLKADFLSSQKPLAAS